MDVLGVRKLPDYGVSFRRRRLRVDTPEINTYDRQIQFCERKSEKLSQKFHIPDNNSNSNNNNNNSNHKSKHVLGTRNSTQLPPADSRTSNSLVCRGSRKSSLDSHYHTPAGLLERRRSSLQLQQQYRLKQPSMTSFFNKHNQNKPSPNHVALPPERCSSENMLMKKDNPNLSNSFKPNKNCSRRESDIAQHGTGKDAFYKGTFRKPAEASNADTDTTKTVLGELAFALHREREQFLRALTTLAINRITTDKAEIPGVERNSTVTYYERNIGVLADNSRQNFSDDRIAPYLIDDNHNKHGSATSSASSSSVSEVYAAIDEDISPNPDKRERINRLRNYLKCSGFGDPNVITTTVEQSEEEKRAFRGLVRRINRGLSYEKQDRLRRKARLDYEMSLMKGESFCEQQEQAYMRTASADMENRDVQLLEDELRIQALREIRHSKKEQLNKQQKAGLHRQISNFSDSINRGGYVGCSNNLNHDVGGQPGLAAEGEVRNDDVENDENPDVDEKSSSDDRDAMSGLIRNPLSRREMRKRILLWVYDVEEAMGDSMREGEKLEMKVYNKNKHRHFNRGTSFQGYDTRRDDDIENHKNDTVETNG